MRHLAIFVLHSHGVGCLFYNSPCTSLSYFDLPYIFLYPQNYHDIGHPFYNMYIFAFSPICLICFFIYIYTQYIYLYTHTCVCVNNKYNKNVNNNDFDDIQCEGKIDEKFIEKEDDFFCSGLRKKMMRFFSPKELMRILSIHTSMLTEMLI